MAVFVLFQLLAALFTPHPLASLGVASLRSAFIVALLAAGVWLRRSERLRPLLWGYLAVFVTAWVSTVWQFAANPQGLLEIRLLHPYYYFVTLGLLAAIALWLTVSWKGGSWLWRLPVIVFSLATLAASGSRGPILALIVGAVATALCGHRRYLWGILLTGMLGLAAVAALPQLREAASVERLVTLGLTGRDEVWQGALEAFRQNPVGGAGPYQIGPYLEFLYKDGCNLTPWLMNEGVGCPAWLEPFRGAWLIAHNLLLHSLAETGILGTLGLLALLGLGAYATWRSRDGLLVSIFWGFMAMSLIDVVTAVPSMGFSELFWVGIGIALTQTGLAGARTPPDSLEVA
ncbi:O-antigen ligase [Deinobacterium chartae]|uniref:O-antigen ligase n=1 Tax=Deinobacterium chartae TaxID=521158 RepID=A0A841HZI4_9DEIO|nr:O-antigen ligase [Deinobacterium chartae]